MVKYNIKEYDSNYEVGLWEDGGVVIITIDKEKVLGLNNDQIAQRVYEIIWKDLEQARTLNNEQEVDWKDFIIPAEPVVKIFTLKTPVEYVVGYQDKRDIEVPLSIFAKDQYGNDIAGEILLISSYGEIVNDTLIIPYTDNDLEITITASVNNISDNKTIRVYPYVEPIPLPPSEIELLKQKVDQQDAIIEDLLFNIIPSLIGGGEV